MKNTFCWIVALGMLLGVGCGDSNTKKFQKNPDPPPNNSETNNSDRNNTNNTNNTNNGTATNNITVPTELCGNGLLDPGEICDPEGSGSDRCPTECPPEPACSTIALVGSADDCTARCEVRPVGCFDDDGCCSVGCDSESDNDCENVCGNEIVEENETCDGNCPTSCDDGEACTVDSFEGSASECSTVCVNTPRTSCTNNDGCCPAGCTSQNDNDCSCQPTTTCSAEGFTCGTLNNGCQSISCGTCPGGFSCQNNECVATQTNRVGDACTSNSQCGAGLECATDAETGFTDGYCTKSCVSDNDCGSGAHCSVVNNNGFCVKSCGGNNDCTRNAYECFNLVGDSRSECGPIANGNGQIGDACQRRSDCSGGQTGNCLTQAAYPDFYQGYCTRDCSVDSDCGSTSLYHCWKGQASDPGGVCVKKTCSRTNYLVFDSNPTVDSRTECWPGATGNRQVGDACSAVWQCSGGQFGVCITDTQANLANGYCTVACDRTTCPNGSTCWQNTICVENCSSDSTCRTSEGYYCANDPTEDIDFCWM